MKICENNKREWKEGGRGRRGLGGRRGSEMWGRGRERWERERDTEIRG